MNVPTGTRSNGSLELRVLDTDGARSSASYTQFAKCDRCQHELLIGVGTLTIVINGVRVDRSGVLVEHCTNPTCENARPHQAKPTRDQPCEHPRLTKR